MAEGYVCTPQKLTRSGTQTITVTYKLDGTVVDNPTAENMSFLLYEKAKELLKEVEVNKVVIYETPTSFAEYYSTTDL